MAGQSPSKSLEDIPPSNKAVVVSVRHSTGIRLSCKEAAWRLFCFQTVEPVDQLLQSMDPAKDRELWVKENKTGEVRPVDLDI